MLRPAGLGAVAAKARPAAEGGGPSRSFSPTRARASAEDMALAPTASPAVHASVRLIEVFENQRRLTAFHKYSAVDLLPIGDPGCLSSIGRW